MKTRLRHKVSDSRADASGLRGNRVDKGPEALEVPFDLLEALKVAGQSLDAFVKLPPSHKREYLDWIGTAKKSEARERRIRETVRRLSESRKSGPRGKGRVRPAS